MIVQSKEKLLRKIYRTLLKEERKDNKEKDK